MSRSATPAARFIGCDVGKTSIVVFDEAHARARSIPNDPKALADFAASLDPGCFVVCEATGGYEAELLAALLCAGVPAHRADARKVKAFIRSFGTLGKTDAIDARALARYARERHGDLAPWQARQSERVRLQALVLTRSDIVADRTAYANRRKAPGSEPVHAHLDAILEALEQQIKAIETDIKGLIAQCQSLARAIDALLAVKGFGQKTAAGLLALMPELGSLGRRQAAALAGLAPHPRQSGQTDAYRRTRGGRPELKRLLFMAALSAIRYNPDIRAFYQRLFAAGKKPLVAITAAMRKLIVIANAKLKPNTAFTN